MYCKNCIAEFREDYTVCPVCGEPLTENLPEEPDTDFNPDEKPCLLCTASNEFEADLIIAKLGAEGIYAFKKFKGTDGYNRIILGTTVLGVDVIVGESNLDEAKIILRV